MHFLNDFRTRSVVCKQTDTLETVPEYLCDSLIKPPSEEECNLDACRVRPKFSLVKPDFPSFNSTFLSPSGRLANGPIAVPVTMQATPALQSQCATCIANRYLDSVRAEPCAIDFVETIFISMFLAVD